LGGSEGIQEGRQRLFKETRGQTRSRFISKDGHTKSLRHFSNRVNGGDSRVNISHFKLVGNKSKKWVTGDGVFEFGT